jgi:hypothetical protein
MKENNNNHVNNRSRAIPSGCMSMEESAKVPHATVQRACHIGAKWRDPTPCPDDGCYAMGEAQTLHALRG